MGPPPRGGEGVGLLWISSDEDDGGIFWEFEIFDFRILGAVGQFSKYFLGLLVLSRDFGYSKQCDNSW